MAAFATVQDVEVVAGEFPEPEIARVEFLLDASAEVIRGIVGVVYPPVTATVTLWPSDGWVDLPTYLRSVDAVTQGGSPIAYERHANSIHVHTRSAVEVTFTAGLDAAPADVVAVNVAMVTQALTTIELGLGLTGGGLSSIAIDDFKSGFADGGASAGLFALTPHVVQSLTAKYGTSVYTTEATR